MMKKHMALALVFVFAIGCDSETKPNDSGPSAKSIQADPVATSDETTASKSLEKAVAAKTNVESEPKPATADPSEKTVAVSKVDADPEPVSIDEPTASNQVRADLASFHEGDEKKRERLAELVDSQIPPDMQVTQWMNSEPLSLADLKGKIVVIDFWATWCGPCIRAIPHNNEIAEKYGDDVVLIGICHSRGSEKMKDMAEKKGIEYPIAIDPDGETVSAYKVNGYPDYYLIDRAGKLRIADCKNSSVDDAIEALLAEK